MQDPEESRKEKVLAVLRRLWWVPIAAASVLAVVLIAMNLLGTKMADWVALGGAVIVGVCIFLTWKWGEGKLWVRILLTAVSVLCGLFCIFGVYFNPYWNSIVMGMDPVTRRADTTLSMAEAHSDLEYLMHYAAKVHPALINGTTPEMREKYNEAGKEIAERGSVTVTELAGLLQSILTPLDDAHTTVTMTYSHDADEPHTLKTFGEHELAGDTLTGINGVSTEHIYDAARDLVAAETDAYGALRTARLAVTKEGLEYLGIPTDREVVYEWTSPDGTKTEERAMEDDFLGAAEYEELYPNSEVGEDFVSWEIFPEDNLAVLTLDECVNNDEYKSALQEMFEAVSEQDIRNVAVDLRENGGGDSSVANEFLKYINVPSYKVNGMKERLGPVMRETRPQSVENEVVSEISFDGNVYVLTSPETFSSAMFFAEYIKDNGIGRIIGETPGNNANGYGELTMFELPNSHLLLSISRKHWERIDGEASDFIEPDTEVPAKNAMEELKKQTKSAK